MNAPKTSASPKTGRGTGLRERAAGTKAKAEKVIKREAASPGTGEDLPGGQVSAGSGGNLSEAPDPIFAAIERHRSASAAADAACIAADAVALRNAGQDTSSAAMAPRIARHEAAQRAANQEWNKLLVTRPTTPAGLVAMTRYVGEQFDDYVADEGAEVCEVIADGIERLAGDLIPPKRDLGGFSIQELSFSLQALGRVADLLGLLTFWSSLGKAGIGLMSDQLDRIDRLRAEIREELLIRKPSRVGEADDRAAALIHDALEGRDWTEVAVMAVRMADEVADLWRRT